MKRSFLCALALLAAGVAARSGAAERDPRVVTSERLSLAATDVRAFHDSVGELPASRAGLEDVLPASIDDAWGRPVIYLRVAGGFWLVSWGADGVPGGTGDAADLVEISR